MRNAWMLALVAACGSKSAPRAEPKPEVPAVPTARIALVEVPAAALGEVSAASYLTVAADGALAIGKVDAQGEVNVSSLAATPTDDLSGWYSVGDPPVPLSADALADAGMFGALMQGGGAFGGGVFDSDVYGGLGAEWGEPVEVPCGVALHLDPRLEGPTALLIPDAGARANVVLEAMLQMPLPVAIVARGDDPRGLALRLVLDGHGVIEAEGRVRVARGTDAGAVRDDLDQRAITVDDDATAQDLLGVLARLAVSGVREVVLDRGVRCQDYSGNTGLGDTGWGVGGGGTGSGPGGGGSGWGTIGTGSGYGSGGGGGELPAITIGEINAKGGADEGVIRAVLEGAMDDLMSCYVDELIARDDATLGGDLKVALIIETSGKVSANKVSGFDKTVAKCVEGTLIRLEWYVYGDDGGGAGFTLTFDPGGP